MAAYSIDLRLRVLRDADAGLPSDELAEKYSVSRAWVDRRKQRRRETGEVAPRKQTRWRTLILQAQLAELAALIREQPDRTLAELQEALRTPASLPTLCRTIKRLGFRFRSGRVPQLLSTLRLLGRYDLMKSALGSCGGRPPTRNRLDLLLGAPERGEAAGAFEGDQRFQAAPNQRGLLLDSGQLRGLAQQPVIDVECRSHMYDDASLMHHRQASLAGPK